MQHDGRHLDRGLSGEPLLDCVERRIARRIAVADPVGVSRNVDEIRIVEGFRRALERRVVELPVRRPQPPQQAGERAAILLEPGAPALGVEW